MERDDGPKAARDHSWAARLHRLWMVTGGVTDVTAMADHVYALLLAEPEVLAVVGTRWTGGELRYTRRLTSGTRPVTEVAEDGTKSAGAARRPDSSDPAAHGPAVVDRLLPDGEGDFAPEHRLLSDAGAAAALECRFVLGENDWATLSVGLAVPVGPDDPLRQRLTQVCDVLVAINRRIVDVRAHERRQVEEAFLAEASFLMDESLDIEETLSRVARLAVPAVAEGCVVHLFQPDGRLVPVARAHVAATAQDWLSEVTRRDTWTGDTLRRVMRGRTGVVLREAELAGGPFGAATDGPGRLVRAVSVSPLRARARALGTLTFLFQRTDEDISGLRMLDDLARRAALAIDTSTSYELRRRHVAQLQRHLLPPALPSPRGLELSAAYAVADASLDVGGDFYDAVQRGDEVALFIGDVCGRGAEAAAMTGLARHTLRTLLEDGAAPGRALERLNQALLREKVSRFVTALVTLLVPDGDGYLLHTACAGHPPPMVLRADGDVAEVHVSGVLMGVLDGHRYRTATVRLNPGDTVVMFTDGLTEARDAGGVMFETRLVDAVRRCGAARGAVAEHLVGMAADFRASGDDDTAVLVARVTERS
ncbi:PP2C family protein-serine/threonine phosphatase [Streptomyces fructofermentans]|uniref:PPM-type phosphatase domain-containing protein n=1 Tax=Streptomyces fructofermentans TaxID=152141 RepID=A0A918KCC0_9ACTN|nr:GAF domain-containing SpoIIE family protein phosphatase [Streptomyces fructofermentans]GGX57851.1 hypothetical protein GCM10010515_26930 [Streptomyces fructofermentans]